MRNLDIDTSRRWTARSKLSAVSGEVIEVERKAAAIDSRGGASRCVDPALPGAEGMGHPDPVVEAGLLDAAVGRLTVRFGGCPDSSSLVHPTASNTAAVAAARRATVHDRLSPAPGAGVAGVHAHAKVCACSVETNPYRWLPQADHLRRELVSSEHRHSAHSQRHRWVVSTPPGD